MVNPAGVQSHYETFLARHYIWMAGGWEYNYERESRFFAEHSIHPAGSGTAIDLGAGCGFASVALASLGFEVLALDFSRQMLDILLRHTGDLPVRTVHADILAFESWSGRRPACITCMGDTLTHLPDIPAVHRLIGHCTDELDPGGKIILACRDYSREPEGASWVIPVRKDPDRIFVCRLEYGRETVMVTDILTTREFGTWIRTAGSYRKIRLSPELLVEMITGEGLVLRESITEAGLITIIAEKPV
jgi:SAM-dependent methyltransferase